MIEGKPVDLWVKRRGRCWRANDWDTSAAASRTRREPRSSWTGRPQVRFDPRPEPPNANRGPKLKFWNRPNWLWAGGWSRSTRLVGRSAVSRWEDPVRSDLESTKIHNRFSMILPSFIFKVQTTFSATAIILSRLFCWTLYLNILSTIWQCLSNYFGSSLCKLSLILKSLQKIKTILSLKNILREFGRRRKTFDQDSAGEPRLQRKIRLDRSLSRLRRFQRRSTSTLSVPCKRRWRFSAIRKPFEEAMSSWKRSPGFQILCSENWKSIYKYDLRHNN